MKLLMCHKEPLKMAKKRLKFEQKRGKGLIFGAFEPVLPGKEAGLVKGVVPVSTTLVLIKSRGTRLRRPGRSSTKLRETV